MAKLAPKLRQTGNERIAFSSRAILCEGKIDQAGIMALADEASLDLGRLNVVVVDCGSRDNIPDYARFCGALGIPYLAIQDGDAGKEDAAKNVSIVRALVNQDPLGRLFEFPVDIETTLGGVKKDSEAVARKMRKWFAQRSHARRR